MPEESDTPSASVAAKLDLSSLNSLSLGPSWSSGNSLSKPKANYEQESDADDRRRDRRGRSADRRGGYAREGADPRGSNRRGGDRSEDRSAGSSRGRPFTDASDRRTERGPGSERFQHRTGERPQSEQEPFHPIVAVDFYPEEEPFRLLTQAIRNSCRTFELFEIARLILEKPERFVCVLKDPLQKDGEAARLTACVIDGLPFISEEDAIEHTLQQHLEIFFSVETVEGEAPAGSFPMVSKCGITGEVIAPPNYHRYRALCREHHAAKLAHLPYVRFEEKLESSRETADIQAWQDKMKRKTRYTLKENPEVHFDAFEEAKLHLLTHCKEKLIRPAYSARFSGKVIQLLPATDPIRRSIDYLLEGQKRFPLNTANHLRGRLRRMNFAVYKRGSKGVSFVCAVKRRFRQPGEVFSDTIQELLDFLTAHPDFPANELPKTYLGIATEAPAEADAPRETPLALRQLKADLRYLVSEGYLVEYSDGRLFVPPQREEAAARPKPPTPSEPAPTTATSVPAPAIPPEPAPQPAPEPAPEPAAAEPAPEPAAPEPAPEPAEPEPAPEPAAPASTASTASTASAPHPPHSH